MFNATFAIPEDGKHDELAAFYAEHKSRFIRIALSKLHNIEDADDAVQEAFSRIVNDPGRFFGVPLEKRVAYVDVIVRNVAVDIFKRKCRIAELDGKPGDKQSGAEPGGEIAAPEDGLLDRLSRDEIQAFVNELPTLQRNVLWLHCIFGLSIDETADRLNISVTVANKRLALARKSIREFIEGRKSAFR